MTDLNSGREVKLSGNSVEFTSPIVESEMVNGQSRKLDMRFSSKEQLEKWVSEQRASGAEVTVTREKDGNDYAIVSSTIDLQFGGAEGLRAIGYVAQTFLAHYFPGIARLPALDSFKRYTLEGVGDGFVWWDNEEHGDLPPNKYPFGHRIVVGYDSVSGMAYARVSFFSTLRFSMIFASVQECSSSSVIIDIDPLAPAIPSDISEMHCVEAKAKVARPLELTGELAAAIYTGAAQEAFTQLMKRIEEHRARESAISMFNRLSGLSALSQAQRIELVAGIVADQSHRILIMIHYFLEAMNRSTDPHLARIGARLQRAIIADNLEAGRLSEIVSVALGLAKIALGNEILEYYRAGNLNVDRIQELIYCGTGAAVVAKAIIGPLLDRLERNLA
jgi:hypothetical protein